MEIWDTDSQHSCICSCVPKEGDLCMGCCLLAGEQCCSW